MTEADIPDVSGMLCECYRWLGVREGLTHDQTRFLETARASEETLLRESREETVLVACAETVVLGLASVRENVITKLYVRPSRHGAGIGRSLYQAAESMVRSAGHATVTLGAFPSAVSFYEGLGLRATGVKTLDGKLAGRTVTLMEKRLVNA